MTEETTTTTTTEERGLRPCFVRHPDAGGQCWEPATIRVHGLKFCEAHGEEARIGAGLEASNDAENYFNRLRSPEATPLTSAVQDGLEAAISRGHSEHPYPDEDYYRALSRAYPASSIPEEVRDRVEAWILDERSSYAPVLDFCLDSLLLLNKLLRVAHEDRTDYATSLIETLEYERQCIVAEAAVALEDTERESEALGLRPA